MLKILPEVRSVRSLILPCSTGLCFGLSKLPDGYQSNTVTVSISDWMFGSRRAANRNKTEVNSITNTMNEMSERPPLVEMSYISLNHTNHLSSTRLEEVVVTIDETLQQQPPNTPSGT